MSYRFPHEESPLDAPPLPSSSGVLVVDEDPAFQLGLKTFLREYVGFEKVFTARSGQEALDFLRAEPSIEVITVDHRMPGMSGMDFLRNLRDSTDRPLAALMITAAPNEGLEAEFRALGNERFITSQFLPKPVQFEKLEPVIITAHEEVLAAKRRAVAPPPASPVDEDPALSVLATKLDLQCLRLSEVERELKAQRWKWRADFWKLAFLVFLVWLAAQFGLLQRLEPHWDNFKTSSKKAFASLLETAPESSEPALPRKPAVKEKAPPADAGDKGGQPL